MADSTLSWDALKQLMITPQPDLVVQGVVSTDERELYFAGIHAEGQAPPLTPIALADEDGPAILHVRMKGSQHRLDRPDGAAFFIQDTNRCLQFHEEDPNRPDEGGPEVSYVGTVWDLVVRPEADRFKGTDFTRPTGPVTATEYLGRPAWEVELAPPSHKPFPLTYVVDAETGLLLQKRNERAGLLAGWTEFRVGGTIPDEVFTWDGPVVTEQEREATWRADHDADMRMRAQWVHDHVVDHPVSIQVTHRNTIYAHNFEDDGSFDGSVGPTVVFSRRPRSRRDFGWAEGRPYTWSSGEWNWCITVTDATLTPDALASIQSQLNALPTE